MHNNFNESKYFLRKRTLSEIFCHFSTSPPTGSISLTYVLQAVIFAEIVYKMINLHNLYKITRKSHSPEETIHAIQCLQFVSIRKKKGRRKVLHTRCCNFVCVPQLPGACSKSAFTRKKRV